VEYNGKMEQGTIWSAVTEVNHAQPFDNDSGGNYSPLQMKLIKKWSMTNETSSHIRETKVIKLELLKKLN
jgi:hypothetical protein